MPPSISLPGLPPFRPRFPWWGGDLQTLASRLMPAGRTPSAHNSERLRIALQDGTGDTLLALLDRPHEEKSGRPLVILIHGLTGSEDSLYMVSQARQLLERGYRVLRINLRGAGPSRAVCGGQYYAGRSQDFRALLALLPKELTSDGVVAVGYSLGGAMLLKYLGEEGHAAALRAAVVVSAPIDLSAACRNIVRPRNWIYHRHLLRQMKGEATGTGASLTARERAAILDAAGIWEYDDGFIAPRHGFTGAENYYERCKPVRFMPGIRVPTLVIAAMDDPWVPGRLYDSYDWRGNKALHPLLTKSGGHVGFHGVDSRQPWSDRAVASFIETGSSAA